jgi:hypothetical protein
MSDWTEKWFADRAARLAIADRARANRSVVRVRLYDTPDIVLTGEELARELVRGNFVLGLDDFTEITTDQYEYELEEEIAKTRMKLEQLEHRLCDMTIYNLQRKKK